MLKKFLTDNKSVNTRSQPVKHYPNVMKTILLLTYTHNVLFIMRSNGNNVL
jgi:hypothetical protein